MKVLHDEKGGRFYLPLPEGGEAVLSYRREGKILDFYSTYVPPDARSNRARREDALPWQYRRGAPPRPLAIRCLPPRGSMEW